MIGYVLCGIFLIIAYLWHVNEKAHKIELQESYREGYNAGLCQKVIKMSDKAD